MQLPPRRKTFVVTDISTDIPEKCTQTQVQACAFDQDMHQLRTLDPARITDRRRLVHYVCQLQGCVKILEEQARLRQQASTEHIDYRQNSVSFHKF
jgi:hypothetical protein